MAKFIDENGKYNFSLQVAVSDPVITDALVDMSYQIKALSEALLKRDFSLDVVLPTNRYFILYFIFLSVHN